MRAPVIVVVFTIIFISLVASIQVAIDYIKYKRENGKNKNKGIR